MKNAQQGKGNPPLQPLSGDMFCAHCGDVLLSHAPAHTDDANRWRCLASDPTTYFQPTPNRATYKPAK